MMICRWTWLKNLARAATTIDSWERRGSVVGCLTRDWGAAGSSLTGVTALRPWARHINPSLVLVQPRKTHPYITEILLMGPKESNQTNYWLLGHVHGLNTSRVQAMDKAQESKVVAALARFFSHVHIHLPHQSSQNLPSSWQKRETPNISIHFSSKAGISSMILSTEVSVS